MAAYAALERAHDPAYARFLKGVPISPPPQAIAAGFTKLDYYRRYDQLNSADVGNIRQNGFKDYLTFAWPNRAGVSSSANDPWLTFAPQSAGNLSISSGALHSTGGASVSLNNVASACDNGAGGYVGTVLGPGGYWEGKLKSASGNTFGSGFYMFPIQYFVGTTPIIVEHDIFENINDTTSQCGPIEWDLSTNPAGRIAHDTTFAQTITSYAIAGMLWQTKAQAGGSQGNFSYWKDNAQKSAFTYTTGAFSVMDTHQYVHFLSSQFAQDCEYIAHWTTQS